MALTYSLAKACAESVEFCLACILLNVGVSRDDALSIFGSLL